MTFRTVETEVSRSDRHDEDKQTLFESLRKRLKVSMGIIVIRPFFVCYIIIFILVISL
jgi:hypothetical protein